jgi:hypothetical protein
MLSPKDRAALSIPSRSDFAGKSAAIREYPGRKSTSGSPKNSRTAVSLRTGVSTKISVRSTSRLQLEGQNEFVFRSLDHPGTVNNLFIYLFIYFPFFLGK